MDMAKRKARKPKANAVVDQYLRPTPEREAHNDFRSVGMAMVVVPPIVRLHEQGVLTDSEFTALAYYRDQAGLAQHSLLRSCIDFSPKGGGGNGPGVAVLSAIREVRRIESGLGPYLANLLRSVVAGDMSVTDWALAEWGAEPNSDPPRPSGKALGMIAMELKYAAGGII
jgi:hypothetical protein